MVGPSEVSMLMVLWMWCEVEDFDHGEWVVGRKCVRRGVVEGVSCCCSCRIEIGIFVRECVIYGWVCPVEILGWGSCGLRG